MTSLQTPQKNNAIYELMRSPQVYAGLREILAPGQTYMIRRVLEQSLALKPETQVLELGCGTGLFALTDSARYIGLDLEIGYVGYARRTTRSPNFLVASAVEAPFPPDSFDAIYSVGLYHHMTDIEVKHSLHNSWRCLKPGGLLVVIDATWPTQWWNWPAYLLRKLDRGAQVRTASEMAALMTESLHITCQARTFYFSLTLLEACLIVAQR